jgi:hypothetical protein
VKKTKNHITPFLNSYFTTSIGIIVIAISTAHYISRTSQSYKEHPYGKVIIDSTFYGVAVRQNWHTIDVGPFLIEAPKTYLYTKQIGVDSKVGQIANKVDTILFDYGMYSYDFSDERNDSNSDSRVTTINGKLYTVVKRKDGLGIIAAYTGDLSEERRLNIVCLGCNDPGEAFEIFKTIKFKQ